jgi:hypothetical protein
MTSINTNITDYTLSELMAIVDVEELTPEQIIENTNYYIRKYKTKNPKLAVFFKEIQSQLLQYAEGLDPENDEDEDEDENTQPKIIVKPNASSMEPRVEGYTNMFNDAIYPSGEKMVTEWYKNEVLTQSDKTQTDKITNRKQKIKLFNNPQVPMNQEQIATTDTFSLPVKQDTLNPNLKNTIKRFINLDSQFRQYTSGIDSTSTDYTCDLSDTIKNGLSLSVYSYQIPFSWYTIDSAYGNTCFWIYDSSSNTTVAISVPSGNYSQTVFQTTLNASFAAAGFTFAVSPVSYNANTGIITLYLNGGTWTDPLDPSGGIIFTVNPTTQIIFFDFTGSLQCNINCVSKSNHYFNNTLGWLMGYRLPYLNVDPSGNPASAILDLNGTKYLILVIDDYNQNHVNNSLVSISQLNSTLKMPMYYSPDIPYTCITPAQQGNNLPELVGGVVLQSLLNTQSFNAKNGGFIPGNPSSYTTSIQAQNGLLIAGKYQQDNTSTQIVLPSAPRTLTNAQLYTINSINNNNNNLTNYLAKAPTSSDILAIIPVKTSTGVPTGSLLVEFSGSLQDSVRTYFGPVNIDRMAVKLLDDKGNILNLNGNDWCVSLIAECLYQY